MCAWPLHIPAIRWSELALAQSEMLLQVTDVHYQSQVFYEPPDDGIQLQGATEEQSCGQINFEFVLKQ